MTLIDYSLTSISKTLMWWELIRLQTILKHVLYTYIRFSELLNNKHTIIIIDYILRRLLLGKS